MTFGPNFKGYIWFSENAEGKKKSERKIKIRFKINKLLYMLFQVYFIYLFIFIIKIK